jgi:protein-S-isoprenylcysteine O-methyltransferase Ste14
MNDEPHAAHEHPWKLSDVVLFPALAAAIVLEWLWPTRLFGFPSWSGLGLGLAICGAGAMMIGWAKRSLAAFDQPNLPRIPTTQLVTDGAFRVSRNPNYLGAIAIAFGTGLAVDSLCFLGVAVVAAIVLDR